MGQISQRLLSWASVPGPATRAQAQRIVNVKGD
jgi:hypothetical protein